MADQPKKDLTDLLQHAKALEESGNAPPVVEGAVMDEVPIEKIDLFESLEEYAIANPAPEITPSDSPAFEIGNEVQEEVHADLNRVPGNTALNFASNENLNLDENLGENLGQSLDQNLGGNLDFNPPEFPIDAVSAPDPLSSLDEPIAEPLVEEPVAQNTPIIQSDPDPISQNDPIAAQNDPIAQQVASGVGSEPAAPETPASSPAVSFSPPPQPQTTPLEKVKKYSESIGAAKPSVAAAYPFSLLITGPLSPEEKEKLLDLITRENMGFREIELEPQFESNRILLPRISEYAGILLVQALRGARAEIKLGPSDMIFSTPDTHADDHESAIDTSVDQSSQTSTDLTHPAESLPITTERTLPGIQWMEAIDTITASAALKSSVVEAEKSPEYQALVDALQNELKYKAHRKGADGIIHYKIQLTSLLSPSHYRIIVTGTAIKKKSKPHNKTEKPSDPEQNVRTSSESLSLEKPIDRELAADMAELGIDTPSGDPLN